jgi:hypothetical protein
MIALKEQELALKGQKIEADNQTAQAKIQIAQESNEAKQHIAQLGIEKAYAELALQEDLTLKEIEVGIANARANAQIKQQDMGVKARVEAEKLAAKERSDQMEVVAERNRPTGPILA